MVASDYDNLAAIVRRLGQASARLRAGVGGRLAYTLRIDPVATQAFQRLSMTRVC